MKECQYCHQPMEDGDELCPVCGKAQTEPEQAQAESFEQSVSEEVTEVAEEAEQTAEAAEETEEITEEAETEPSVSPAQPEKKKNATPILVGVIVALVAVIIALIVMIVNGTKKPAEVEQPSSETVQAEQTQTAPSEAPTQADEQSEAEEGTQQPELTGNGVSYTIAAEDITPEKTAAVVAGCGEDKLTAGALNLYYWQQYYSFANNYGMYLSYLLDSTQPLELQMYNDEKNWQQMFLDGAVDMFFHLSAIRQEAEKNGYQLSAEDQATLDSMPGELADAAATYGYESADAYLQDAFGPMVTMDDYLAFVRANMLAGGYLNQLVDAEKYTDEDISAYFDENAETYAQSGVVKTDKPNIDIRHILIMPEETDADGNYTDAAWETARKTAQEVYDKWQAGDKTEDSFAALAKENSADGSSQDGGLITDVHPGQMVEEFNDWCFADGRKPGDHGLVKSMYGYHVMYFSKTGEEVYWKTVAEDDYKNARAIAIEDGIVAKYMNDVNLDNAAIFDVLAAQAEAQK